MLDVLILPDDIRENSRYSYLSVFLEAVNVYNMLWFRRHRRDYSHCGLRQVLVRRCGGAASKGLMGA